MVKGNDGVWIPSPQIQGVHNLNDNDLILPNMKVWDKNQIESIFPLHIAQQILEIPSLDSFVDDKLVWVDNTNGHCSVKSGYKIMMNVTGKTDGEYQQDNWPSLRKILAPPKAKHLLWRISKGFLPTRMRSLEKRVPCPMLYPLCNQENEDD
jgi:hypothetical protein